MAVLRGGAVGDFIVTLPALAALRARWPAARLEVIGYPRVTGLALLGGLADAARSLDAAGTARLFSLGAGPGAAEAAEWARYDIVVSYLHDPSGSVRRHLAAAGVRTVLEGSPMVEGRHAADHLLLPLQGLAIYGEGPAVPRVAADAGAGCRLLGQVAGRAGPWLVLHPGSGSPRKNWPAAGFLEAGTRLAAAYGLAPVLSAAEADEAVIGRLRAMGCGWPVLQDLPLVELAGALAAASLYVGNDSGVSHLAAAAGCPTVAVFGPTDPATWAPRGPAVRIVSAPERSTGSLLAVPAAAVCAAAAELLDAQGAA